MSAKRLLMFVSINVAFVACPSENTPFYDELVIVWWGRRRGAAGNRCTRGAREH